MQRIEALKELAAKVEAGEYTAHHHAKAFPSESAYGHCTWHDSHKAANGSTDAAKALHEAVLPGWDWSIESDGEVHIDQAGFSGIRIQQNNDQPPAWLIAASTIAAILASWGMAELAILIFNAI